MAREIHVLFSQGEEREKENSRWMFSRRNMETEVARGKHGKRVGHEQDGEEEEMCIPTSEYIFHGEGGLTKSSHIYELGNAVLRRVAVINSAAIQTETPMIIIWRMTDGNLIAREGIERSGRERPSVDGRGRRGEDRIPKAQERCYRPTTYHRIPIFALIRPRADGGR